MTVGTALGRKQPNSEGFAGKCQQIPGVAGSGKWGECWASYAQRSNTGYKLYTVVLVVFARQVPTEKFTGRVLIV